MYTGNFWNSPENIALQHIAWASTDGIYARVLLFSRGYEPALHRNFVHNNFKNILIFQKVFCVTQSQERKSLLTFCRPPEAAQ